MSELEICSVSGPAFVQDGGRPGHMHQGIPPGGAMVPELLAAANRAAGNPWDAAALEIYGALTLVARGPTRVGLDDRGLLAADGERIAVPRPDRARVRYLALRGGIDVPAVLGGRGTLGVAMLGGLDGRALRKGDRLPAGALPEASFLGDRRAKTMAMGPDCAHPTASRRGSLRHPCPAPPLLDLAGPVRVVPGPDPFPARALETLLGETFTVSPAGDRTGIRLAGPALERSGPDRSLSAPMVRGAIQVPASGEPIILGPDHPTTGGYPVIATVIRADWGALAARRPGAAVRFQAVTTSEGRAAWRSARPHSAATE